MTDIVLRPSKEGVLRRFQNAIAQTLQHEAAERATDVAMILAYVDNAEHLSYEGSLRKAELYDKRAAEDFYNSVVGSMTEEVDEVLLDSLNALSSRLSGFSVLAC